MSATLNTPGGIYCAILAACAIIVLKLSKIHGPTRVPAARCQMPFACIPALSIFMPACGYAASTAPTSPLLHGLSSPRADPNSSALLECLQVTAPISHPPTNCQQTLMVHTFANAYGRPFVGFYTPPDCSFNRVTFNFTVTSAGRQFDRLGLMFLGDIEVFRTSTAEPTQNGIIWTYTKDMTSVLSLFNTPQKIIFDLGNLIDDTYTGSWNTELTATFITENQPFDAADLVVPLSAHRSATNESSAFSVPETAAVNNIILPTNVKKAVFSIAACGQGAEEFWWSNVLSSDTAVFGNDTQLYGHSAFRELQLLIDGTLVGVAWPFPIIFTGGIVPGFWRPVVGIDAFDLHEDEIDITPLVPLLSDGQEHTFQIRVVGIDDDAQGVGVLTENIESSWIVTGKIFLWLDSGTSNTTGSITSISVPDPVLHLLSAKERSQGAIDVVKYSVNVTRQLSIESMIFTSGEGPRLVTWKQDLTFYNLGILQNKGNVQTVQQMTFGVHNSSLGFYRRARYPLWVSSSYHVYNNGNVTIWGQMRREKDTVVFGELSSPNSWRISNHTQLPSSGRDLSLPRGSMVNNRQNGTATYASVPAQKKSYGTGSTEQIYVLRLIGQDGVLAPGQGDLQPTGRELYSRHILATNNSVVHDRERFGGQLLGEPRYFSVWEWLPWNWLHEFAERGVQALIGRGPV